jgi:hypothetical protein
MPRRKEPRIPDAILDQLLAGADPKTAFDPNGLIDDLKKALAERVLNAEMDHHLAGEEPGNRRNGYGKKTVITDTGQIELAVPRDRQARFDPQLIAKYQRRFPGFDDKIISMYARGMSTREIVGHLHDLYGIEVSLNATARRALRQLLEQEPTAPPEAPVFRSGRNAAMPVRSMQNAIAAWSGAPGWPSPTSPLTACAIPSRSPGCASIRVS